MKLCLSKTVTPEMDGKGSLEPELKPSQVVGQEVEGSASGLPAGYQDILTRFVQSQLVCSLISIKLMCSIPHPSHGNIQSILPIHAPVASLPFGGSEDNLNSGCCSGLTTQSRSAAKVRTTATMLMWRVAARFV